MTILRSRIGGYRAPGAEATLIPTLLEQFRALLIAPLPRAAFALSLAGIGFALGIAIGNPTTDRAADTSGSLITASADDVVF